MTSLLYYATVLVLTMDVRRLTDLLGFKLKLTTLLPLVTPWWVGPSGGIDVCSGVRPVLSAPSWKDVEMTWIRSDSWEVPTDVQPFLHLRKKYQEKNLRLNRNIIFSISEKAVARYLCPGYKHMHAVLDVLTIPYWSVYYLVVHLCVWLLWHDPLINKPLGCSPFGEDKKRLRLQTIRIWPNLRVTTQGK